MAAKGRIALGFISILWLAPAPAVRAQQPPDLPQLRSWIRQLDAEKFDDREAAALSLSEAGEVAIAPIAESLTGASRERISRGLSVLVKIALKGDEAAQEKAEAAVEALSLGKDARAARIAAGSLESIQNARADKAREALVTLGAQVGDLRTEDLNGDWRLLTDDCEFVEIGPQFRGTVADLDRLKKLKDVRSVTISLPSANDAILFAVIEKMPQLLEINLKRTKITAAGLAKLEQLPRLHHLWICYSPLDANGATQLAKLPSLNYLTLFGTGVNAETEATLTAALPNTKVDVRSGAFLGLGGLAGGFGLRVTSISPGSAAEKSGLKVDDSIQIVEGRAVATIKDLTSALKRKAPGDKVQVEYLSEGEPKKAEITLGEWP